MVTRRSFFPLFLSCSVRPCLGPGYVRKDFIGFYSGKGRLRQRRFPLLPPTETKNRNEFRRLIGQVGEVTQGLKDYSSAAASKGAELVMVIGRGRCEEANPCPSRFRRSGRSILNRKSDFTCTAAAAPPSTASAQSFRRLVCPFVLWSGGAEGGSTKRPFQNTEDGSTGDDRSLDGRCRQRSRLLCNNGGKHRRGVADHCRNFPPNRRRPRPRAARPALQMDGGRTLMECPSARMSD